MNDHPSRVMTGRADVQGLQLLESCSFRWIFDGATRRIRRTPRDATVRDGTSTGELQQSILAWKEQLRVRHARLVLGRDGGRHPLRPFGGWAGPQGVR
jgi:hypothetical protein